MIYLFAGNTQMVEAVREAFSYSFRPDAVKSVIAVLANPCDKSILPVSVSIAYDYISSGWCYSCSVAQPPM